MPAAGCLCLIPLIIVIIQILHVVDYHQRNFKGQCIIKDTNVQTTALLQLFNTVYQCISMYKQLSGSLGNIQIVFKEPLDGKQCFMIQGFDATPLEHLVQECFAQSGGQMINQTSNAQIVVAYNDSVRVKYLAHFQRHLGFLKGTSQILYAHDHGTDAHIHTSVELAAEGIRNGTGELFQILTTSSRTWCWTMCCREIL